MTQHSSGPTRWGGKSSVASVESSVICCGIQHDQHGIQLPTEDRVRPRALRRSTGNHCGIPRKQPGIQCPRRSLLIRYGTSDPEAGSTLTQALGRSTAIQCGIQCQEEDRACASTRADPLRSGARAQWREHNPVGAGAQSRSTAIRRGIQRPELSPEGSQRPTRLRYHPTWDPAAGASRRPSRSAAIHPGIQRRREPIWAATAAWRMRRGGAGPDGGGAEVGAGRARGAQGQPASRRPVPTFSCSFSISSLCASSDSSSTRRCAVSFFRNSISLRGPERGCTSPPPTHPPTQHQGDPGEVGKVGGDPGTRVSGRDSAQRGGDARGSPRGRSLPRGWSVARDEGCPGGSWCPRDGSTSRGRSLPEGRSLPRG